VGLQQTDAFINLLKEYGGTVPASLQKERGRYLDAMIDSHKYNAEGRAVVFGEPDFVYAVSQLCMENGMLPVVAVTGTKSEQMKEALQEKIRSLADVYFVEKTVLADGCDFDQIEQYAEDCGANLMIGNSDGRRVAHKLDLPLVRCAFPVHDHVGGQRVRMLGYEGSLMLLDQMTNVLMERTEHGFRKEIFNEYYRGENGKTANEQKALPISVTAAETRRITAEEKTKTHPCFNGCGSQYARMHLPVAPKCNIQCNYCVRKYDCVNESRPGVTTQVLSPQEAFEKYLYVKEKMPNLKVVGIAGPGDALREFEKTKKTLELIRAHDPDVTFCLSTNGLMLPVYADELVALDVTHVTITINAVDPAIGAKIYKYVDYRGRRYHGETAAAILLANQLAGLEMLAKRGVICKVNIVTLKGINDHHIPQVVQTVKDLGGEITNIMQLIPVEGSAFENMPLTSMKEISEIRKECSTILKQMYHCKQCRADAIGTLDNDQSAKYQSCSAEVSPITIEPLNGTLYEPIEGRALKFAVSSKGGMHVDQHFGQASDFYIYEYKNGSVKFSERRSVDRYCDGSYGCDGQGGGKKQFQLEQILQTVADCDCIITMRIGESPKKKLAADGVTFLESYGRIEDAVLQAVTTIYGEEASIRC
jgi:nitrogenase cofactor biosynthesis protein NifB